MYRDCGWGGYMILEYKTIRRNPKGDIGFGA